MEAVPLSLTKLALALGVSLLLLVGGAAMAIFGVSFIKAGFASKSWPTATGEIRHTRIVSERSSNSSSRSYSARVTYAYAVEGRTYTSRRYSLGDGSSTGKRYSSHPKAFRATEETYPVGKSLPVYYDPTDPTSAVLKPGPTFGTYVPIVLGSLFFTSGLVAAIATLRPVLAQR